jgi:hypothetical protein
MRGEYIDLMELLVVSDALRVVALLEYLDSADLLSPIHISPRANRSLYTYSETPLIAFEGVGYALHDATGSHRYRRTHD